MSGGRRRLPAWNWSMTVTSIVAVVAAAALGGCGLLKSAPSPTVTVTTTAAPPSTSTTPTDPSVGTSTGQSAGGLQQAKDDIASAVGAGHVQEVDEFRTDEVYCRITDPSGGPVGCELLDGAQVTSDVCRGNGAGVTGVGRISLVGMAPDAVCNSDTMLPSSLATVEEGQVGNAIRLSGADLTCLVEADGVACVTADGAAGWHLDTLSFEIWPSGPSGSVSPTSGH